MAIDFEVHSFEVALDDMGTEVCHGSGRVGLHLCLGVLDHHTAVFVIGIGNGEGIFRQVVEKSFLGIAIILESLMIVQMVACKVGKQTTGKLQSADTLLGNGMTGTFHKGIFAASLYHLVEQTVQLDGVGGGVVCWNWLAFNVVTHGGEQSAFMSELSEHII